MRGLFPSGVGKYGIRSQARRELILRALSIEEEAQIINDSITFNQQTYGNRILSKKYKDFAQEQLGLFETYRDKYQLKPVTLQDRESRFISETQYLIDAFKYIQKHGTLQDMDTTTQAKK